MYPELEFELDPELDPEMALADALLCFAWSRMLVIDGWTGRGHAKESNLPFEGFLEALCRVSALMALPTDAEVNESACLFDGLSDDIPDGPPHDLSDDLLHSLQVFDAGCADAFEYVTKMREADDEAFHKWVAQRNVDWGAEPRQPLARCVAHLLAILFGRMKSAINQGTMPSKLGAKAGAEPEDDNDLLRVLGGTDFKNAQPVSISSAEISIWFARNEAKLGLLGLSNTTRSSV